MCVDLKVLSPTLVDYPLFLLNLHLVARGNRSVELAPHSACSPRCLGSSTCTLSFNPRPYPCFWLSNHTMASYDSTRPSPRYCHLAKLSHPQLSTAFPRRPKTPIPADDNARTLILSTPRSPSSILPRYRIPMPHPYPPTSPRPTGCCPRACRPSCATTLTRP